MFNQFVSKQRFFTLRQLKNTLCLISLLLISFGLIACTDSSPTNTPHSKETSTNQPDNFHKNEDVSEKSSHLTDRDPGRNQLLVNEVIVQDTVLQFSLNPLGYHPTDTFSEKELTNIAKLIQHDIDKGFPGAVLLIAEKDQVVMHKAFGSAKLYDGLSRLDTPQPMTTDTLFDLASLTKVYSTTLAIMLLESQGKLTLEDELGDYLPAYQPSRIKIKHLLYHTSGLKAGYPFYKKKSHYHSLNRQQTYQLIPKLKRVSYPNEKANYSDLGYIVLGELVEKISGQSLDYFVSQQLYQPLGLKHITYRPLENGFQPNQIAATERLGNTRDGHYSFDGARTTTLQGQVHDELAYYSMNAVSGNAGLFSDATDLAILSRLILNNGRYGKQLLLKPNIVAYHQSPGFNSPRYASGFDMANHPDNQIYYGSLCSSKAIAKTGWTGTVSILDPENELIILLLTNKRHSPFVNDKFEAATTATGRYRPIIEAIYQAYQRP